MVCSLRQVGGLNDGDLAPKDFELNAKGESTFVEVWRLISAGAFDWRRAFSSPLTSPLLSPQAILRR